MALLLLSAPAAACAGARAPARRAARAAASSASRPAARLVVACAAAAAADAPQPARRQALLAAAAAAAAVTLARPALAAAAAAGVGDSAPAFELPSTAGGTLSLASLTKSGKWTVLYFYNAVRARGAERSEADERGTRPFGATRAHSTPGAPSRGRARAATTALFSIAPLGAIHPHAHTCTLRRAAPCPLPPP
jgi:hypothetical protein